MKQEYYKTGGIMLFKEIRNKFFKRCAKNGKITGLINSNKLKWLYFPLVGLLALFWFIIRVIPKPSRAGYPCLKVAAPLASSFVVYLIGLSTSTLAFLNAKKWFKRSHITLGFAFILLGLLGSLLMTQGSVEDGYASYSTTVHPANEPMGMGKGIFPGRVVWVHDPDATNENCVPNAYGHAWFLDENNDQDVIDQMLSDAIQALSGEAKDSAAWQAIFEYHNDLRGKGKVGYKPGEKIFIKINATSNWGGNINKQDLSVVQNKWYGMSETSPHLVFAVLRQLVNVVGVAQEDIYVGDPLKHIYKHCYELWAAEFPNLHFLDHDGWGNREKVIPSQTAIIHYSDRGKVLRTGSSTSAADGDSVFSDYFYTIFEEMEYMINIPTLKAHKHAGITMFAKNHFGSHTRNDARHLHNGLVAPEKDNPRRAGYGLYRVQIDLLGHELSGKKNLFYLLDAIWTADYELNPPVKWLMAPFDDDYTSSIFLSFDPIATESVGFDFLRSEFTAERGLATYPQMEGVDDYLQQAADATNWPEGIIYDPEKDGTPINSLGTHEHWNNAIDKQYSRNLASGEGIELYKVEVLTSIESKGTQNIENFILDQNYPNPFNPTTTIRYTIPAAAQVQINIYNMLGQTVKELVNEQQLPGTFEISWNGQMFDDSQAPSGVYYYKINAIFSDGQVMRETKKMMLMK